MLSSNLLRIAITVIASLGLAPLLSADQTGVNGGVIAVKLPHGATEAEFNDENQLIIRGHAIVAIPHEAEAEKHKLIVSFEDGSFQAIDFEVQSKEYEEQHITIENQDYVT
ncbi:MAG: hypothetical protein F4Z01_09115, partial [Gammaproteobacteria bacterium]|nr:hypothetical protein [Gammaproteobacteria bacterium]